MGFSANASVVVGFAIEQSDFWIEGETTDSFLSCPEGHRGGKKDKFCSECGGKIGYQTRETLTINPNFEKYIGDDDPEGTAGEAWASEWLSVEEQMNPDQFDGFELMRIDTYQSSEDRYEDRTYGLALELLSADGIESMGHWSRASETEIGEKVLRKAFKRARDLANALGIDREVELHLTTYASC